MAAANALFYSNCLPFYNASVFCNFASAKRSPLGYLPDSSRNRAESRGIIQPGNILANPKLRNQRTTHDSRELGERNNMAGEISRFLLVPVLRLAVFYPHPAMQLRRLRREGKKKEGRRRRKRIRRRSIPR